MIETQLLFKNVLPRTVSDPETSVLIFDKHLEVVSKEFRRWMRQYPHRMGVSAGESLKDVARFPTHLKKLAEIAGQIPARTLTVVAVGGGSVGDFAGFFASVFKRGVRLIHVPSTWLAAIDSSHGGKTAMNLADVKNQIGTFYPASQVVLVRSLLASQPEARVIEAMAELGKIALIDGGEWVERLHSSRRDSIDRLWLFLKPAIEAKMKIVRRDPRESSGLRQILNLGHTFGHVLEAELGWSHGRAVAQGLFFSLEFGEALGVAKEKDTEFAMSLLASLDLRPERSSRQLKKARVLELLLKDKKRSQKRTKHKQVVTFVFFKRFGKVERRDVDVNLILKEAIRQGWVSSR